MASDMKKNLLWVDLTEIDDDDIIYDNQTIKWNFNVHVPITKEQMQAAFGGYINRGGFMVGPSDFYGVMKTFRPNLHYRVRDVNGIPQISSFTGKPRVKKPVLRSVKSIPKVKIQAKWYSVKDQSPKPRWFKKALDKLGAANVFGSQSWGSTIMTIDGTVLKVPLVDGLKYRDAIKEYNGARIIKFGEPLPTSTYARLARNNEVLLVSYTFKRGYLKHIVMNDGKGPGMFVESHPFPHYAFAANRKTKAIITLGRKSHRADDLYDFTSFTLPYGYVMYIPENTIHTDGLTIGSMAISVDVKEDKADTAFLRSKTGELVSIKSVPPSSCIEKKGEVVYVSRKGDHDVCKTPKDMFYMVKGSGRRRALPITCASKHEKMKACKTKTRRKTSSRKKSSRRKST
uniref:Uncharacterized protein n=1 Tax=viral metagenome TaxID=1070528 RepID=A0A6C0BNV9_9ZZZZ